MVTDSNELSFIDFNEKIVIAFMLGESIQFKFKKDDDWIDYDMKDQAASGGTFGPWRYNKIYEWRVKSKTIVVEVTTIVKSTVEIPSPFVGEVPLNSHYVFVIKDGEKWYTSEYKNYTPSLAKEHQKQGYVYLDNETAEKAFKILTGE